VVETSVPQKPETKLPARNCRQRVTFHDGAAFSLRGGLWSFYISSMIYHATRKKIDRYIVVCPKHDIRYNMSRISSLSVWLELKMMMIIIQNKGKGVFSFWLKGTGTP
jgi:hypothetical protein